MLSLGQDTIYMGTAAPASGGGGSGDAVWGAITGTLSDQTDLQNALNAKQNTLTAGSGITISNGTISATGVESIANQNTNTGAVTPLKVWNGTEQEWNTGGGSLTWYNWQYISSSRSWISETSGVSGNFISVTYGNNKYIAVGYDGAILSSSDGSTWTSETSGVSVYLAAISYGNNKFIAVGGNGTILSSTDGSTWTSETSGVSTGLAAISYGNNKFIAVGKNGVILSSTDGSTWTSETSGVSRSLSGVTYGNNKYIAVGGNGTILSSTDGSTWTSETLGVSVYLAAISYGNNKFIAVGDDGDNGVILSSTDGSTWTSETSGVFRPLSGVTYGNYKYIAVGDDGVILSSLAGVSLSCYTLESEPTTASTVYSEPSVISTLTITAVGTGTITLSDTNTYNYNASGNQTTTSSVGESHPDYLCNIDGVGVKIGTTDVANLASYTAGNNVSINNGVISATDTTYSAFGGATSQAAGSAGLVPAPTTSDVDKYLKGDGTWGTVSGGGLQNTATGSDSLSILGVPTTSPQSINIGVGSEAQSVDGYSVAIGYTTVAGEYCVAIGGNGASAYNNGTAIGANATAGVGGGSGNIVIGYDAYAHDGNNSIAIGYGAIANGNYSIALGYYANAGDDCEFVVGGVDNPNNGNEVQYVLLNIATGKIPNDRINGVSGSFTSQDGKTVTVTNGVITSIV